jgi:hypothetical protein
MVQAFVACILKEPRAIAKMGVVDTCSSKVQRPTLPAVPPHELGEPLITRQLPKINDAADVA